MKRFLLFVTLSLSVWFATAQVNLSWYKNFGISYNCISGLAGFNSYMSSDDSYASPYLPTFGLSYSYGVSVNRFSSQIDIAFNLGFGGFYNSHYLKKEDYAILARVNYMIPFAEEWGLEPSTGIGLVHSYFYYATQNTSAWNNTFDNNHWVVPLTLTIWSGSKKSMGLMLQYLVVLGAQNTSNVPGMSQTIEGFGIQPSTLSIGALWGF